MHLVTNVQVVNGGIFSTTGRRAVIETGVSGMSSLLSSSEPWTSAVCMRRGFCILNKSILGLEELAVVDLDVANDIWLAATLSTFFLLASILSCAIGNQWLQLTFTFQLYKCNKKRY